MNNTKGNMLENCQSLKTANPGHTCADNIREKALYS